MGLWSWEKQGQLGLAVKLDFQQDVVPLIQFLTDLGVPSDHLGLDFFFIVAQVLYIAWVCPFVIYTSLERTNKQLRLKSSKPRSDIRV